jgi:rubrerythrin
MIRTLIDAPFQGDAKPAPVRDAELAIARMLREHGRREGAALAEYRKLADTCDDDGVRYLLEMILADEERHHRQIDEMLHQVQSFLWEVDVEPKVPHVRGYRHPELREVTERLLELERRDAAELRRLRRQMRSQPSSSMLPLLVELMIHDTQKHIEILKFIKRAVTV